MPGIDTILLLHHGWHRCTTLLSLVHAMSWCIVSATVLDTVLLTELFTVIWVQVYFSQFRKTPFGMLRLDPQDAGPGYRNVIGIPGGVHSPLFKVLQVRCCLKLGSLKRNLKWIHPCATRTSCSRGIGHRKRAGALWRHAIASGLRETVIMQQVFFLSGAPTRCCCQWDYYYEVGSHLRFMYTSGDALPWLLRGQITAAHRNRSPHNN